MDFVVLDTGRDIRAPIILGRPFLSTTKAIIYAGSAKNCFQIKYRKEWFSFKNRILYSPTHPQVQTLTTRIESKNKKNQPRKARRSKITLLAQKPQEIKQVRSVWRKKEVQPSRSPSPGPIDAPKE